MKTFILPLVISLSTFFLNAQSFCLKSKDLGKFALKEQLYDGYGCKGGNISPQLFWENIPKGTKSFAITMFDPDAPTGHGWWHWLIFNIPVTITELVKNAGNPALKLSPKGSIQSLTDFGSSGYGGPCPPVGSGSHHYILTVYALKTNNLNLCTSTKPEKVKASIEANSIASAKLAFIYSR